MPELLTAACPKCGATVDLTAVRGGRDRATCRYCGSAVFAESHPPRGARTTGMMRVSGPGRGAGLAILGVVLLGAAAGLVAILTRPAPTPGALSEPHVLKSTGDVFRNDFPKVDAGAALPLLHVASDPPARLIDSDGDKVEELLLPVTLTHEEQTTFHYGVFSTEDGKLQHQTPPIDTSDGAPLTAAAFGRILLAQRGGKLTSYDLNSGALQWSSALGEEVAALCKADPRSSDSLQVVTEDARHVLIDVRTGRQSETRSECKVPLSVASGRHAPADRRDYRAPEGTEAWVCGGVRVMGSENYSVPDACQARGHVPSDRLDGMEGHAIWRFGRAWLVLGVRKPGTYVPMVGLLSNGRFVWKSEVPAADPLTADTGGPRVISMHEDRLLVGYSYRRPRKTWITQFSLRDGTRKWSVPLSEERENLIALVQNERVIVSHSDRNARLLSPETGEVIATIGQRD